MHEQTNKFVETSMNAILCPMEVVLKILSVLTPQGHSLAENALKDSLEIKQLAVILILVSVLMALFVMVMLSVSSDEDSPDINVG